MSIKITEKQLRGMIREEYSKALNEDESEMSREGVEAMRDLAFQIAKKLVREIDTASMSQRIDKSRLFSAVIDQAKIQMKD